METKRYKPLIDKLYYIISIPTLVLTLGISALAIFDPGVFWIMIPVTLMVIYFLLAPLFGYVELREGGLFIKYGFFMKKEIPYEKIRSTEKDKKWYSESMMSLKNALEHVNIRYNSFDVTTVSVVDNDGFVKELNNRCRKEREQGVCER